jgi:endonuclease YncB( thermonuclease family)
MGNLIQFKRPLKQRPVSWRSFGLWLVAGVLGVGTFWYFGPAQSNAQTIAGQASVIDGDTIEIHGTRIRLFGIDAPEGGQTCTLQGKAFPCGRRASFALADKIGRQVVECQPKDRDRYGRVVAVCRIGGEDINGWMVAQGWALAYRYYSLDYVSQEQRAESAKAGMWQGQFQAPWDWRRGTR